MVSKNDAEMNSQSDDFHYIVTRDKDTADTLKDLGFEEIVSEQNKWIFINK